MGRLHLNANLPPAFAAASFSLPFNATFPCLLMQLFLLKSFLQPDQNLNWLEVLLTFKFYPVNATWKFYTQNS